MPLGWQRWESGMPRRVLTGVVLAVALTSAGPALLRPALGAELALPPGPYKYLVIDQDVKGVLVEFGRNVGLPVDVSDQVKGRLRGQISTATAREFLDGLCESYGLVWYFDGATLHINANTEVRTELVNVGGLPPAEATEKLKALGVSDLRFPVGTTADTGIVSVSGPPPFLSLARKTLTTLANRVPPREDSGSNEIRVRVFRGGATPAISDEVVASRTKG
jgi:type II secretory pathway component GspD/PulD (secretin)